MERYSYAVPWRSGDISTLKKEIIKSSKKLLTATTSDSNQSEVGIKLAPWPFSLTSKQIGSHSSLPLVLTLRGHHNPLATSSGVPSLAYPTRFYHDILVHTNQVFFHGIFACSWTRLASQLRYTLALLSLYYCPSVAWMLQGLHFPETAPIISAISHGETSTVTCILGPQMSIGGVALIESGT